MQLPGQNAETAPLPPKHLRAAGYNEGKRSNQPDLQCAVAFPFYLLLEFLILFIMPPNALGESPVA